MARSWHYPRWRRYLMQAVMWGILGATLGLAALVNHQQRVELRVELGPATTYDSISVRLPRQWQQIASDGDPRVVARAVEPDALGGRIVTVMREPLRSLISPLEYLIRGTAPRMIEIIGRGGGQSDRGEPAMIGGWPGVVVRVVVPALPGAPASAQPRHETYACTVVPSQDAILVKLESTVSSDAADKALVQQVAEEMQILNQPQLGQSGETIAFDGGIRAIVPQGFAPIHRNDPLRLERQIWAQGDAANWTAVTLVPCLLVADGGDDVQAIHTLLVTRDPRLRGATIRNEGPRSWRIEPAPQSSEQIFPARLYLLADDRSDGTISAGPRRALLAIFRGGLFADQRFDDVWASLSASVQFTGDPNYAALLLNGADEVALLRAKELARLLPLTGEDWWLWHDASNKRYRGWTRTTWDLAEKSGQRDLRWRGPDRRLMHLDDEWSGDLTNYRCTTIASDAAPSYTFNVGSSEPAVTAQLRTTLNAGMVETLYRNPSAQELSWTRPAPPQFVPGGWLPLLMGHLTRRPMILRTDSFIGLEGAGPRDPMTVIITPSLAVAQDEQGRALREVQVQVSGTGQLSKWYFNADETLHHVDYPGGLQRLRKSKTDIDFAFLTDPALQP